MSDSMEFQPIATVLEQLARLSAGRATGTAIIATADNRALQILLREGAIVALTAQRRRGMQVVEALSGVRAARLGFNAGVLPVARGDQTLPNTAVIMDLLREATVVLPARVTAPAPGAPAAAGVDLALARTVVEEELAEFIGPMASLLCEEAFRELPPGAGLLELSDLVNAIMREAGEPQRAVQVSERVALRLRG